MAAAVGERTNDEIEFHLHQDGALGGIIRRDFDNRPRGGIEVSKMYTITLREVLERFESPSVMDYLSLDVEGAHSGLSLGDFIRSLVLRLVYFCLHAFITTGAEMFIMQQFPFEDYRFNIMTIERPKNNLIQLLNEKGYEMLCRIAHFGETLWAHKDAIPSLDLPFLRQPGMCYSHLHAELMQNAK